MRVPGGRHPRDGRSPPRFRELARVGVPDDVDDGVGESPKLFITTTGDESADVAVRQMERVPDDESELLLLPGSGHGQALFTGKLRDRVMRAITDWLAPLQTR